jgi:hypothetical protein
VHATQSIGTNAAAVYFRSVDAAQRFVAAKASERLKLTEIAVYLRATA